MRQLIKIQRVKITIPGLGPVPTGMRTLAYQASADQASTKQKNQAAKHFFH